MMQPPGRATRFFEWFCKKDFFEELQGDLEENYQINVKTFGSSRANRIYYFELFKMIRPSVIAKPILFPQHMGQLNKNYLLTSIRSVRHNPGYILSNIIGLALALAIMTIGYFNYRYNKTFNHHYEKAAHIYKIHGERDGEATLGSSSIALAPLLQLQGMDAFRYHVESVAIKDGRRLFQERLVFADNHFFKALPQTSIGGQELSVVKEGHIFISEKLALKLFNEPYPVGEILTLVFPSEKEQSFVIQDVFKEQPHNVSFHCEMITSFSDFKQYFNKDDQDWAFYVDGTFIDLSLMNTEAVAPALEGLRAAHNQAVEVTQIDRYRLDNILEWPGIERFLAGRSFYRHLHPASVAGTFSTAIAILLLACFNFINTSLALSGKRLKEIAVRKVMGGNRRSTITQFMTENALMVFASVLLAICIASFLIPAYNAMMTQEIIQLDKVPVQSILLFCVVLILIVSLLSGGYPSLYISRFSALDIFKDSLVISSKNRLMMILLTFQFALCFYNFSSLHMIVENTYYQSSLDRGYELDRLINVPLEDASQFEVLKQALLKNNQIEEVVGTQQLIGFDKKDCYLEIDATKYDVTSLTVGNQYPLTTGLRLVKGAYFSSNEGAAADQIMINETMEQHVGRDLLHQQLSIDGKKHQVIGVVEDFNLAPINFDNFITPTYIKVAHEGSYRYATVRTSGYPMQVNTEIEETWYQLFPQRLYKGFLQKKVASDVEETNAIMININLFSSIITVLISAIGLYTLISLIVQRRRKEFGVRKVLGASQQTIAHLLSKNIYLILLIAMMIGLTTSYIVIGNVFDLIYAYHIKIQLQHFILPSLVLMLIVVLSIGFKVYQTSRLNPVDQLRTE